VFVSLMGDIRFDNNFMINIWEICFLKVLTNQN
jgi:hypothetical protein